MQPPDPVNHAVPIICAKGLAEYQSGNSVTDQVLTIKSAMTLVQTISAELALALEWKTSVEAVQL